MEMNKGYVYNTLISIAFLTVEFFQYKILIKNPTKLHKQTMLHHIMAVSGFSLSMVAGYGFVGLSNASLVCEFSSIFLNFKDMFTKDTRNSCIGQVNQFLFFLSFTVFRVIMFPILAYRCFALTMLGLSLVGWFRKFAMIFCLVQA